MVSDKERGKETKGSLGYASASSYFPTYVILSDNAEPDSDKKHAVDTQNITKSFREARNAAFAHKPFTYQVNQHVWYPQFWLQKLDDNFDLSCDDGKILTSRDDARPSWFPESDRVARHAMEVLDSLGVELDDLYTLHLRRGDVVAEEGRCGTSVAAVKEFMSKCDVLSRSASTTEALVFFTDETNTSYLEALAGALSLPRWGGRVFHGDKAVLDVLSDADKEDNYYVYAVASAVMSRSQRQWAIRATRNECKPEDTCRNPLLSTAAADAQLMSELRQAESSQARVSSATPNSKG